MIYSRSCEYAIRALMYLAQVREGKYVMARQIAEEEAIPAHFLAKILQQLAKRGFLKSSKGPTGGFCLNIPADEISLIQIVEVLDGLAEYDRCITGLAECSDETCCGMHDEWKQLKHRILEYLRSKTIGDLVRAVEQKRKRLATQSTQSLPEQTLKKNPFLRGQTSREEAQPRSK